MRRESIVCSGAWLPLMARLAGINSKDVVLSVAGCGQSFGSGHFYSGRWILDFSSQAQRRAGCATADR